MARHYDRRANQREGTGPLVTVPGSVNDPRLAVTPSRGANGSKVKRCHEPAGAAEQPHPMGYALAGRPSSTWRPSGNGPPDSCAAASRDQSLTWEGATARQPPRPARAFGRLGSVGGRRRSAGSSSPSAPAVRVGDEGEHAAAA